MFSLFSLSAFSFCFLVDFFKSISKSPFIEFLLFCYHVSLNQGQSHLWILELRTLWSPLQLAPSCPSANPLLHMRSRKTANYNLPLVLQGEKAICLDGTRLKPQRTRLMDLKRIWRILKPGTLFTSLHPCFMDLTFCYHCFDISQWCALMWVYFFTIILDTQSILSIWKFTYFHSRIF